MKDLADRNSKQPSHLISSYPIETQTRTPEKVANMLSNKTQHNTAMKKQVQLTENNKDQDKENVKPEKENFLEKSTMDIEIISPNNSKAENSTENMKNTLPLPKNTAFEINFSDGNSTAKRSESTSTIDSKKSNQVVPPKFGKKKTRRSIMGGLFSKQI